LLAPALSIAYAIVVVPFLLSRLDSSPSIPQGISMGMRQA
jgi:hypothetical protein